VFLLSFAGKKVGKESRPKKKLQFFRVGAAMSDSATALPGKLTPVAFVVCFSCCFSIVMCLFFLLRQRNEPKNAAGKNEVFSGWCCYGATLLLLCQAD